MRRIVVISIVALLMGSVAFAQSVESANGYDWRSFTPSQQHAYVIGFLSANSAAMERAEYEGADRSTAMNVFYFDFTVEELSYRISAFYSNSQNRGQRLVDVIYAIAGKAYWN